MIYIDKTRRDLRLSPLWWLKTQASTLTDQNPSDESHWCHLFGIIKSFPPKKLLHLKKRLYTNWKFLFQMLSYLIEWSTTEKTNLRDVRNWSYLAHHFLQAMRFSGWPGHFFNFTKALSYLRYPVHQVQTHHSASIAGVWSLSKSTTLKAALWIMRYGTSTLRVWPKVFIGLNYLPTKLTYFQGTCRWIDTYLQICTPYLDDMNQILGDDSVPYTLQNWRHDIRALGL